jgi:seryl-tRNA(Sec) selenium transferase
MKATKEALLGTLAALAERRALDLPAWSQAQREKVSSFVQQADRLRGLRATEVPDPTGMPFSRVCLSVEASGPDWNATALAARLKAGKPPIWLMEHAAQQGKLYLELVPLQDHELQVIIERIAALAEGRS